jgi:polygalacturonase
VVVPAGTFLTGAIHLKSGVNLHVAKGATIRFSTDPNKYLPVVFTRYECVEAMNYSPFIYALGQENIAITGEGTIDGQGSKGTWYSWKTNNHAKLLVEMGNKGVPIEQRVFGEGHGLRPNFIQPVRCRNVLIEGVRIIDSPMWVLHPLYCTNVTIRGVTVDTQGPNSDGCDPDSCTDVLIKDCNFSDGDDCIAVKSGRDGDGRRVNIPCENVVIQNCTFKEGHGGVTMGSETAGGIRNVFAENCDFDSPDLDMAMRFKTNPARGGFIENIYLRNCSVKTAKVGIHMTMRYSSSGAQDGDSTPVVRNIDIRDSTFAKMTKQAVFIEGYSETVRITDVTIANCNFLEAKGNSMITNASNVRFNGTRGAGLE